MGNLRRLVAFIFLFVFFWPIGNADAPFVPGLSGGDNYLLLLSVIGLGIIAGLISEGWKEGDGLMDSLFLSLVILSAFEIVYSLSLGNKVTMFHMIPFLYSAYFLGRLVEPEDVEKYLPYVFAAGMFFVFLAAVYTLITLSGQGLRFGTRTSFYAPVGIAFGIYMLSVERGILKKVLFFVVILLSSVVLVLFGNRTAYVSTVLLLIILFWSSFKAGEIKTLLFNSLGVLTAGAGSIVFLAYAYLGPIFVAYSINRLNSILSAISRGQDTSVMIRKYDFAHAMEKWTHSPFLGWSPGDYMFRELDGSRLFFIDNAFAVMLWKYGALGFLVFSSILLYSAYIVWSTLKREYTPFSILISLLFINMLVISLTTSALVVYVHVANLAAALGLATTKYACNVRK